MLSYPIQTKLSPLDMESGQKSRPEILFSILHALTSG